MKKKSLRANQQPTTIAVNIIPVPGCNKKHTLDFEPLAPTHLLQSNVVRTNIVKTTLCLLGQRGKQDYKPRIPI